MNECERDILFMTFRKDVTISRFPFKNSCFTEIYKTNLSLLTLFLVLFCPINMLTSKAGAYLSEAPFKCSSLM